MPQMTAIVETAQIPSSFFPLLNLVSSSNSTAIVSYHIFAHIFITRLMSSAEHGVMFYSNAMANVANGARKKIHGGSGISGKGDAYGPQSMHFLLSTFIP